MHWQSTPYFLPLLIASAVSIALAIYAWRRRSAPGVTPFVWLMLAAAEWSFAYGLKIVSVDLATKIFWNRVEYLGAAGISVAWLVLVLQYTGQDIWLNSRRLALLIAVPLCTLLLVWTNGLHSLMWRAAALDNSGSFSMLNLTRGVWFWVFVAYSYSLLLAGMILLIRCLGHSSRLYRKQGLAMVLGALWPWVGNALYLSGMSPFGSLDLTPFGFTLTGLGVTWGLFRYRLLDLVPVARDAVLESMGDAAIVLDLQKRIVDLNPAAEKIIGRTAAEVIGQPMAALLKNRPDLVEEYQGVSEARAEVVLGGRYYDLRISPLYDRRNDFTGRLVLLRDISDRRQAESALREAHERLNATLNALPDLLFEVDRSGLIHDFRSPRPELLYVPPEEFLGKVMTEVLPTDAASVIQSALEEAVETGRHAGGLYSLETPAGPGWFELSVSAKGDPKTPEGRLIVLVRDVTERRQAEEAQRESEARYRSLFDGIPQGLYRTSPDGRIVEANAALAEMLGYPDRESLLAEDATNMYLNPRDRERWKEAVARDGVVRGFEMQLVRRDGTTMWVIDNSTAAFDATGQALYYEGSLENITERVEAEEALRHRNRELALLNQVSQDLAATLELHQITDRLLKAVTKTIGAEGASVWLWDEDLDDWLVCRAAYQQHEDRGPLDMRLRPGRGIAGWVAQNAESVIVPYAQNDPRFFPGIDRQTGFQTVSLLAVPLLVQGRVIGVLEVVNKPKGGFAPDDLILVETLAASAAIAMDNARLVEELREYAVELEASNEELDAFAHTVAHDLKNPLAKVVGFCEVLREAHSAITLEELDSYLNTIAQQGRKMSNIIDELLLLSSVRKRDEVEMRPLEMGRIVEEALERLTYLIEERQAEIIVPENWPVALGYGPWVEEVWTNYISNAVKYGGRRPRVELGVTVEPNGVSAPAMRFWVRDNGLGLTPDEQTLIFQPFTRLDWIRAKGHGLGLSIVRRILDRLGGEVAVESQVGRGSEFSFTLQGGSQQGISIPLPRDAENVGHWINKV